MIKLAEDRRLRVRRPRHGDGPAARPRVRQRARGRRGDRRAQGRRAARSHVAHVRPRRRDAGARRRRDDLDAARRELEKAIGTGRAARDVSENHRGAGRQPVGGRRPGGAAAGRRVRDLPAPRRGLVARVEPRAIGRGITRLGGGRTRVEDVVDPTVGFVITARPGDWVEAGDPLATIFARDRAGIDSGRETLSSAIVDRRRSGAASAAHLASRDDGGCRVYDPCGARVGTRRVARADAPEMFRILQPDALMPTKYARLAGLGAFGACAGFVALYAFVVYISRHTATGGMTQALSAVAWISVGLVVISPDRGPRRDRQGTSLSQSWRAARRLSRVWTKRSAVQRRPRSPSSAPPRATGRERSSDANPFAAPSSLPFGAPRFDLIRDDDYAPAIEEGMYRHLARGRGDRRRRASRRRSTTRSPRSSGRASC